MFLFGDATSPSAPNGGPDQSPRGLLQAQEDEAEVGSEENEIDDDETVDDGEMDFEDEGVMDFEDEGVMDSEEEMEIEG